MYWENSKTYIAVLTPRTNVIYHVFLMYDIGSLFAGIYLFYATNNLDELCNYNYFLKIYPSLCHPNYYVSEGLMK